ncbi:MAG: hypothetical protein RR139_09570 [Lachnospiraceae bacterium]
MGKNFIRCGFLGWCLEILFTAFDSFRKREMQLVGHTSLWMFPIYGMAAFLKPICAKIKPFPLWIRSLVYSGLIFTGEYLSGRILTKHNMCPWDYSKARANIKGVIRLDYAPFWMITGLIYETVLLHTSKNFKTSK